MKKTWALIGCSIIAIASSAQQKNFLKLNPVDCVNCVSATSYVLEKDPFVTLVVSSEFARDSNDVLERFHLEPFRERFVWSKKLYDSLSSEYSSELIQFFEGKIINRCALKKLTFIEASKFGLSTICPGTLSNNLAGIDYDNFLILSNYLTERKYYYSKRSKTFEELKVDTNLIRRLYLEYFKNPTAYADYCALAAEESGFKPTLLSVVPENDTCLMAVVRTYMSHIKGNDELIQPTQSIIRYYVDVAKPRSEIFVLWPKLSLANHGYDHVAYSLKGKVYFGTVISNEQMKKRELLQNLVRLSQHGFVFKEEKFLSATAHEKVIEQNIFSNYSLGKFSQEYVLKGTDDKIVNLITEEQIKVPFADSIFGKLNMDAQGTISFNCSDMKYNPGEQKFYLLYNVYQNQYYACFKKGASEFEFNRLLFPADAPVSHAQKVICLSADGKSIVFCPHNEDCIRWYSADAFIRMAESFGQTEE